MLKKFSLKKKKSQQLLKCIHNKTKYKKFKIDVYNLLVLEVLSFVMFTIKNTFQYFFHNAYN